MQLFEYSYISFALLVVLAIYKIWIYPIFISPLKHMHTHYMFSFKFSRIPPEDIFIENNRKNKSSITRYITPFGGEWMVISSPSIAKHIFTNCYDFIKPPSEIVDLVDFFGNGVLFAEGDEHKRQRKIIQPAFHVNNIKNLVPLFWSQTQNLITLLDQKRNGNKEVTMPIMHPLGSLTLDIICYAGFGFDLNSTLNPTAALSLAFENLRKLPLYKAMLIAFRNRNPEVRNIWPFKNDEASKSKDVMFGVARKMIKEKSGAQSKAKNKDKDILSVMFRLRENDQEEGFTDEELEYEVVTFLAAGSGTTQVSVLWVLYQLSKHPDIQDRVRKEVQGKLSKDSIPTSDDIESFTFLDSVCKESMRVIAPIPQTPRMSIKDDYVEGHFMPKHMRLWISMAAIQRSKEIWGEDADDFRPSRWASLTKEQASNYAFMPFINGNRACIGRKFSEVEMRVIIAKLLLYYEVKESSPGQVVIKNSDIVVLPKCGLPLKFVSI